MRLLADEINTQTEKMIKRKTIKLTVLLSTEEYNCQKSLTKNYGAKTKIL